MHVFMYVVFLISSFSFAAFRAEKKLFYMKNIFNRYATECMCIMFLSSNGLGIRRGKRMQSFSFIECVYHHAYGWAHMIYSQAEFLTWLLSKHRLKVGVNCKYLITDKTFGFKKQYSVDQFHNRYSRQCRRMQTTFHRFEIPKTIV